MSVIIDVDRKALLRARDNEQRVVSFHKDGSVYQGVLKEVYSTYFTIEDQNGYNVTAPMNDMTAIYIVERRITPKE